MKEGLMRERFAGTLLGKYGVHVTENEALAEGLTGTEPSDPGAKLTDKKRHQKPASLKRHDVMTFTLICRKVMNCLRS
jgi:hypothetical protein